MHKLPAITVLVLCITTVLPASAQRYQSPVDTETQIAHAVAPAPKDMQGNATVLGYNESGELVTLRAGDNGLICVADEPGNDRFQAVCYHESLEPYMARGRELREQGVTGMDNIAIRHQEAESGELAMPEAPAVFYNMIGDLDGFDPTTAPVSLYAIYVPWETSASTGMPGRPALPGGPWIMRPGTPSAHIMVVPPAKSDN